VKFQLKQRTLDNYSFKKEIKKGITKFYVYIDNKINGILDRNKDNRYISYLTNEGREIFYLKQKMQEYILKDIYKYNRMPMKIIWLEGGEE